MTISFYNTTFDKAFSLVSPESVIQAISGGEWMQQVLYLRSLNKTEYDAEKKKLPAVTWSGSFQAGTRSIETVERYSQLVVIDVDKLDHEKITLYKTQLSQDEYVKYCFVSPSGTGIKFVVQVNTSAEHHRAAFLHLQNYFENKYFLKVDPSGKDVSRLCYISWDPQMIIKESKIFDVDLKFGEIMTQNSPINVDNMKSVHDGQKAYNVAIKWIENGKSKFRYEVGSRNTYIHALACALNRLGIQQDITIDLIQKNLETPDLKWHQSVKSAYFHHQFEHGKYQYRDIGVSDFQAPEYVIGYQDAAISELMTITAMLFSKGVPKNNIEDLVFKLVKYYHGQGWVDQNDPNWIHEMMNYAINSLNHNIAKATERDSLSWKSAEDLGAELLQDDVGFALPTFIESIDKALGGGLQLANFYGLIGFGGVFKSIILEYWAYRYAMMDIPVLYLNCEMSILQFYERLSLMALDVNVRYLLSKGELNKQSLPVFISELEQACRRNIFVYNGQNFKRENIASTINNIEATTGKKIKAVLVDGLGQMDSLGREEAPANIHNAGLLKEIAKETGATVVALVHCSGKENKLIRNTGAIVRGGSKMLTQMDGYLSTSLLIDEDATGDSEDLMFIPNKFYLRLTDKRSTAGVVSSIVNVTPRIHLNEEFCNPGIYETKNKNNNPF